MKSLLTNNTSQFAQKEVQEADTTRFSINRISKRQATFFGHVKRREKVQNLVTTGMIVPKQHQKMLDGLSK